MLALAAAASLLFGHSAEDRPLRATRVGEGPVKVLVVGSIHGNETAGRAVLAAAAARAAAGGRGAVAGRVGQPRRRAPRHAPERARRRPQPQLRPPLGAAAAARSTPTSPGRRAFSEPESRAVRRLVRRIRPDVSVWYHQHLRLVNLSSGADPRVVRGYARARRPARADAAELPRHRHELAEPHATRARARSWSSCPPGRCPRASARRHADAVLGRGRRAAARAAAAPRPRIVWRGSRSAPPAGPRRAPTPSATTARATATLRDPKVIVEHFTASGTFSSAFNTFAANAPDVELHERPGVCAHFVVDRDGTIYQLVSLELICRHTVGLNDRAIGIEHVGFSDAEILGRPAQLRASLRLTRWLQARYGIRTRDVIGHAESLSSPYHHERVARLRKQTHGDFAPPAMRRYRARL